MNKDKLKESVVYVKGTWIYLLIGDNDIGEKLDKAVEDYIRRNNKQPEGYLIQADI
jgi:hypothetical protein